MPGLLGTHRQAHFWKIQDSIVKQFTLRIKSFQKAQPQSLLTNNRAFLMEKVFEHCRVFNVSCDYSKLYALTGSKGLLVA